MPRNLFAILPLCGLSLAAGCVSQPHAPGAAASQRSETLNLGTLDGKVRGQLFDDLGPHTRPVTTASPDAQTFFNQGLTWMYSSNHDEAIRSFRRALEFDPDCAMAWWGISLASGPQYNHPVMTEQRTERAWHAMHQALERIDHATPVERALIEALQFRNANPEPADRASLNAAYSEAMKRVMHEFPNDSDVAVLYADSMMVRRPWKLYTLDHEPHEDTPMIVAALERAIALDPDNPGALHVYIHAIEASHTPEAGLFAARRLEDLAPAAGHLQHMPSHIYVKTGYWNDAIVQNAKAMAADQAYRARTEVPLAQNTYMTHNAHMLAYAAMMSGREREAMAAARDMWANVSEDVLRRVGPALDRWMCSVYDVQKRFGRWDAILAEPGPPDYMPLTTATWRAARAVAYAAKKDFANAEREYEAFRSARSGVGEDIPWGRDAAQRVLEVSEHFVAGEIALQRGDWDEAARRLEQAAAVEDTLSYGEPPAWLQPVRHTLGAVYLKAGRFVDAERVYREDLAHWPKNGWSLFGLARALEEQGRSAEAHGVMAEYREAWKHADEMTVTSCKCIPAT